MYAIQSGSSKFHQGQILTEGLILIREDICDWITALFQDILITGDTFLRSLHTGVLLCDLLNRIYQNISPTRLPSHWPKNPPDADRRAVPLSFKARDNVSQFLAWCRSAGLRNTILFETKGLMNSDEEKNVVLTLLHLGEICADFNMPVPQFAKFKKELDVIQLTSGRHSSICTLIDNSEDASLDSGFNSARSTSHLDTNDTILKKMSRLPRPKSLKSTLDKNFTVTKPFVRIPQKPVQKNNIRSLKNVSTKVDQTKKVRSKSIGDLTNPKGSKLTTTDTGSNNVDIKIRDISKRCCCENKFKIERTTMHEGMYKFGSKNIFVRVFKGNVMLRIGGGWETLNEYLNKVDPCYKNNSMRKSVINISDMSSSFNNHNSEDVELTKIRKIKLI